MTGEQITTLQDHVERLHADLTISMTSAKQEVEAIEEAIADLKDVHQDILRLLMTGMTELVHLLRPMAAGDPTP